MVLLNLTKVLKLKVGDIQNIEGQMFLINSRYTPDGKFCILELHEVNIFHCGYKTSIINAKYYKIEAC